MTPRFNETLIRLNISLGKLYEPTIIYKQYAVCLTMFSVAYKPVQIETKSQSLASSHIDSREAAGGAILSDSAFSV